MLSRILRLLTERRSTQPHDRDEYAEPFGDIPMIIHADEDGDFLGRVHALPDTNQNGCNHG